MEKTRISIYDTTLRDGEQSPGAALTVTQKVKIALELDALGVDVIEAGFPIASAADFEGVKKIAESVKKSTVCGFARARKEDIDAVYRATKLAKNKRLIIVFPTSDMHLKVKIGIDKTQAIKLLNDTLEYAKLFFKEIELITEDGTRSEINFLVKIAKQCYSHKITHFTVADTVGFASPFDIEKIFNALNAINSSHSLVLGIHCHNDLGLATINSLTALRYGARQIHLTINGIGERAGNTALEEVVLNCHLHQEYFPYEHNVDFSKIWEISQLVAKYTGIKIPKNKAVIGQNTFSHGSGIHQDGMIKNTNMYEIFPPNLIGAPKSSFPITRHSGKSGLMLKLKELEIMLRNNEIEALMKKIKSLDSEKIISDDMLIKLIKQ